MSWIVTLTKCSPQGVLSNRSEETEINVSGISGDYGERFWFDVGGISTWPSAGDTYTNNGSTFTLRQVHTAFSALDTERTAGSNDPSGSLLIKSAGGGDANITFSSWNDETIFLKHDSFGFSAKPVLEIDNTSPTNALLKIEPSSIVGMNVGDTFDYVYTTCDANRSVFGTDAMDGTPILWDMEIDSIADPYIWLKGTYQYSLDKNVEIEEIEDITFEALGVKPYIINESEEIRYWGGGYRKVPLQRIGIDIKCRPFQTRGNFYGDLGQVKYWDIQRVLYGINSDIFIKSLGSNFERWNSSNLGSEFMLEFRFPFKCELYESQELSAEFENNRDRYNFRLCSPERMDLE